MNSRFALSAILAVGLAPVAAVKADTIPVQYNPIAIGASDASSINGAGQVVGSASPSFGAPRKAYFWNGTSINWIGLSGYSTSTANGVNGAKVVGTANPIGTFTPKGYLYDGGTTTILPTLGGANCSPMAINGSGVVVGFSQDGAGLVKAFAYNGGVITNLGTLGGPTSNAMDINGSGVVVGSSRISAANSITRAYLHNGTSMSALPALWEGGSSFALGVNDGNVVVGMADEGGVRKPVYWSGGQISKISDFAGQVNDVNNSGTLVGGYSNGTQQVAFLFKSGLLIDLNNKLPQNSGWRLFRAVSINDNGYIVCSGLYNGAPATCVLRF
ncbi:MAG: hypothetical protein ACKO5K_00330 [Armatimonadota bacterium]